jgi:hypothetical protein
MIGLRLRGGGDDEQMSCVAILASGARKGKVCGKPGKKSDGNFYCGYHFRAAKKEASDKIAQIEKLMGELGMTRDDVVKAWEGGEGSSDVPVGVPVAAEGEVVADEEEADETEEVVEHDLD